MKQRKQRNWHIADENIIDAKKYQIIREVTNNHFYNTNIGLFSIAPCKLIALNILLVNFL